MPSPAAEHVCSTEPVPVVPSLTEVPSRLVVRCQDHPAYRGQSKPDRFCAGCDAIHRLRGATCRLPAGANTYYAVRVGSA